MSRRLTFLRPNGGHFQLTADVERVIAFHIQVRPEIPEAGGVLLGRHILGTHDIVVDQVTVPMAGDRRQRTRFYRARRQHQKAIERAWCESNGTCIYLGEWHTHPEPTPLPSPIDRREWRRKLIHDRFHGPLFFLIAGTGMMCVWEGSRRGSCLYRLRLVHGMINRPQ